ncbi:MAG: TM2 domain-containing protein [Cyanobacteria bacterium J06639_1]
MHSPHPHRPEMSAPIAYGLWALCIFGFCGIHRFYLGRPISGFIWLFTFGLFGFGQLFDLLYIPAMVKERNLYLWSRSRTDSTMAIADVNQRILDTVSGHAVAPVSAAMPAKQADPMTRLLRVAADHNNTLSLGRATLELDLPPDRVEDLLKQAVKQNIATVDNDPESGAVRFHFDI